jgi:hypothetical protein
MTIMEQIQDLFIFIGFQADILYGVEIKMIFKQNKKLSYECPAKHFSLFTKEEINSYIFSSISGVLTKATKAYKRMHNVT